MNEPQKHLVYIALGTNLGDRYGNLLAAIQALAPEVVVLHASAVYVTPPWGVLDQPDFLNQVIQAETTLFPFDLLHLLKRVEKNLGRVETVRYGPRLIDLDILFFDDFILEFTRIDHPASTTCQTWFCFIPSG